MTPTTLIFVVCRALADQGPVDVNGFPVDGVKIDDATCRNEVVEMYDAASAGGYGPLPDFSNPYVCSRMSLVEAGHWESLHPGWYVKRVKCPRPDGTFPGDVDA